MAEPGIDGLLARARRVMEQALREGALRPIATRCELVADEGLPFIVRVATETMHKPRSRPAATFRDPFAPWDPAMFVADVSPTHVALLNKFPVVDGHLLFVTRVYEEQDAPISAADFASLAWGLGAIDGLGFYNSGPESGASQPHKHLQLVTLPFTCPSAPDTSASVAPVDALLAPGPAGTVTRCAALPFEHALVALELDWREPEHAGAALRAQWEALLGATGLRTEPCEPATRAPAPYNLLVTRRWMMVVPRSAERWGRLSVNALGFAGSLFVRSDRELATVREAGPMSVLRAVAQPIFRHSQ